VVRQKEKRGVETSRRRGEHERAKEMACSVYLIIESEF
jgi:hypothetical protein